MMGARLRELVLAATVVLPLGACYVEAPAAAYGYTPAYYDGAVVYYDASARPYYYVNGAAVYISPASPRYPYYADHWRTYGPYYNRWYTHEGYRYRAYRSPTYHPYPTYRAPGVRYSHH